MKTPLSCSFTRRRALALAASPLAAAGLMAQTKKAAPAASPDARLKWFRDAKFGLFIHWGLYSIPAGDWNGQWVHAPADAIMSAAKIPVKEYEKLALQFKPTAFDAEAWVKFAEDCGMKYIVFNAKDHDGFAMYRSLASKYNVYDATPFHRDPLKELAAVCARRHMKLGIAYSQSEDWHEPNGAGNTWDFGPDDKKNFDQYFQDKAERQVRELMTNYGPLAIVWFDAPALMNAARAQRMIDLARRLQPGALINGNLGVAGDYTSMAGNQSPEGMVKGAWELPATANDTWGFSQHDAGWKTTEQLTFKLADTVSKGGNYLLNMGPTAQGVIPNPAQGTMTSLGTWLKKNGEAIYAAGPSPFGEEFGSTAWRCTTKPGKLFLHLYQWPKSFELTRVKSTVTKAYLLADASRSPLQFSQQGERLSVSLPEHPPFEGEMPDRINPAFVHISEMQHLRVVLVLEIK